MLDEDEPVGADGEMRRTDAPGELAGVGDAPLPIVDDDEVVAAAGHLGERQRILFCRLNLSERFHGNFRGMRRFPDGASVFSHGGDP